MRTFVVLISIGVSLFVTACNNDNSRVSVNKRPLLGKTTSRIKGLQESLKSSKCLPIDKLIKNVADLGTETILIYTNDVDLGVLDFSNSTGLLNFQSALLDDKSRIPTVLKSKDEPILEALPANNIQSSSISYLLSPIKIDDNCEIVTFKSGKDLEEFEVLRKEKRKLSLRHKIDKSLFVEYLYPRSASDKLTIKVYRTNNQATTCNKPTPQIVRTYILDFGQNQEFLNLNSGYVNLISKNVSGAPKELEHPQKNSGDVLIRYPVMVRVQQLLNAKDFNPTCSATKEAVKPVIPSTWSL